MRLKLETRVDATPETVWQGFDETLFLRLAPPLPRLRLLRFDGCHTGDAVVVEIDFLFFKQIWESTITEQGESEDEVWFVDCGKRLPFFLRQWTHRHQIQRDETGSNIVDDIEYHSPWWVLDILLYPLLWLQFAYRRPVYRKVFGTRSRGSRAKQERVGG